MWLAGGGKLGGRWEDVAVLWRWGVRLPGRWARWVSHGIRTLIVITDAHNSHSALMQRCRPAGFWFGFQMVRHEMRKGKSLVGEQS